MSAGRVLLVEDHDDSRIMLRRFLELEGFEVAEAACGLAALEKLRTGNCNIVVLDLRLPDMDGLRVVRAVRAIGGNVPIIILSAQDDEATIQAARSAGTNGFLSKPVDIDRLTQTLRRLLGQLR